MRICNLYCGIGGNRKYWNEVKPDIEVTAVELDPKIASIYQDFFPKDKVIVADAHKYLEEHYKEFDFIWSSPPCQSHSSFRQNICVNFRGTKAKYPDMKLYEEIIFLKQNAKCKWIVENVKPYYQPLIKPDHIIKRHLYWNNFCISTIEVEQSKLRSEQIPQLQKRLGFDLSKYKTENKRQILRNCVEPEVGKQIFEYAINEVKTQQMLF